MSDDTMHTEYMTRPRASTVLIAALVAGIDGNLLLRGGTWRAGFAVWIAGLALSVVMLGGRVGRERLLMLIGLTCAAFGLAWRDAELLYTIDLLSVLCMGALLLWRGTGMTLGELTLVRTVRAGVLAVLNTVAGAPGLLSRGDLDTGTTTAARRTVRALVIGVAIAAVPLFIVTGLLTSSDAIFRSVMDTLADSVFHDGFSHLVMTAMVAWVAAGWLRAALGDPIGKIIPDPTSPRLPFLTLSVGLYALLALLLAFVITQARVLFGGAEFLRTAANLTVANYARDGFFQLIAAAGVVLVTLVLADWLLAEDDHEARRHLRLVSGALVALVALLLVSSATRIVLYMNEFGLSVDRAFASAAIIWVAGVLVAFGATTLRGRPVHFMRSAILVTVAWVASVNVANPEALVVRVNAARARAGQAFDVPYHAQLSADALTSLVQTAAQLPPAECLRLVQAVQAQLTHRIQVTGSERGDWRSMNVARVQARRWLASDAVGCPSAPVP